MNTTDEIKQRLDIVDVVSQYIKLTRSGRNYKANCPFHSEKTASFFVFPEKQSWHCFGACATGGDIFNFVMKKEGIDFSQALRMLAERANITLSYRSVQTSAEEKERQDTLLKLNEVAAEYYHYLLMHDSEAETARKYAEGRGLSRAIIDNFQLGYSPNKWDGLLGYLSKAGYRDEDMLAVGLTVQRDTGGFHDRFRNRLMFPIRDIKGRVVGFGGRALDDSTPKYLNSPQSMLFDKSSIIYGIERAAAAVRQHDSVVITEGYMDTLAAHQFGFENTVASMGTALTEKQISTLRKLTRNIIVALDADAAGLEATARSIATIDKQIPREHWLPWVDQYDSPPTTTPDNGLDQGTRFRNYNVLIKYEIQVVEIKGGKDPDEIIRSSPEKWAALLKESQPIIDFTLKKEIANIDKTNPKDKSAAVSKLLPILSHVDDTIRRVHYVEKLSLLLELDKGFVRDAIAKFQADERKSKAASISNALNYSKQLSSSRHIEKYLLALLLQFNDLREEGMNLSEKYFELQENKYILLKWQCSENPDLLGANIDPAIREFYDQLITLGNKFPPSMHQSRIEREYALNDCINRLIESHIKNRELEKILILSEEKASGDVQKQLAKLIELDIKESQQLRDVFKKRGGLLSRIKGA
jgi:DNA primase